MHYRGTTKTVPEIVRELGVDGIVEGSVMHAGDRVRITAQLVHAGWMEKGYEQRDTYLRTCG